MALASDPWGSAHAKGDDERRLAFGRQVREALVHLNDFAALQRLPLVQHVREEPGTRGPSPGKALQQALRDAIGALRPPTPTDPLAPVGRSYHLLTLRYVEGLDVASVLPRLALGRSEYYRDHQRAVEELSALLWERWHRAAGQDRPRPRTNLPASLTSFVGRERELAEVTRALATTRLLTLTGTGGCGKTRLALRVAEDLLDAYPDGIWLVELAPLADPALLPQTVAFALGLREAAGRPILDTLMAHLDGKELLLLLDNCEHLIEAAAQLAHVLLRSCPRLRILATSREALGLAGETSWRVPSLPLPRADGATIENVQGSDAARLFAERARAVQPGFAVTGANAPGVAQICRRLDGIPLAIELAAARVRVLSVEQIAQRLDDRFRFLTGGSRGALPRQQTLRATLDWSYALLAEPERALFRRLAVFAGGFSLEAAGAVGGGPGDVLDLLTQLVDKSLVVVEEERGEARYWLLETVRQYGRERLVEAEEAPAARDRHRDWYADLAERAEPELRGPRQEEWRDRLEAEHDNLRAALAWGLEGDLEASARLAGGLSRFWMMWGDQTEGLGILKAILTRDRATRSLSPRARASVLVWTGMLGMDQGDLGTAREPLEESLALYREVGDTPGIVLALRELGLCLVMQGELGDQTRAILEESLRLARAGGDRRSMGLALDRLALLANFRHDYRQAREALMEARGYYRELGDVWSEAGALMVGGWSALMQEDLERARQDLDAGLAVARRIRDRYHECQIIVLMARLARKEGDDYRVEALLKDNLRLLVDNGVPDLWNDALCSLAELAVSQGKSARGMRLFAAASSWDPVSRAFWLELDRSVQANRDTALAVARAALGEEAFSRAWAEGQAMTPEQALEYVLAEEAD